MVTSVVTTGSDGTYVVCVTTTTFPFERVDVFVSITILDVRGAAAEVCGSVVCLVKVVPRNKLVTAQAQVTAVRRHDRAN